LCRPCSCLSVRFSTSSARVGLINLPQNSRTTSEARAAKTVLGYPAGVGLRQRKDRRARTRAPRRTDTLRYSAGNPSDTPLNGIERKGFLSIDHNMCWNKEPLYLLSILCAAVMCKKAGRRMEKPRWLSRFRIGTYGSGTLWCLRKDRELFVLFNDTPIAKRLIRAKISRDRDWISLHSEWRVSSVERSEICVQHNGGGAVFVALRGGKR
jgi:hypothetical protein